MAEELRDASYSLPRSMVWATAVNGLLMFITTIMICYCIGDLEQSNDYAIVPLWDDIH